MLAAGANRTNAGDSIMPGDYESWPAPAARNFPQTGPLPPTPQQMMPTQRTPFPQIPPAPAGTGLPGRTPFPQIPPGYPPALGRRHRAPIGPAVHRIRSHRHRRRSLTPDIVIDRLSRGRRSWGGRRVITIPLDNRPTLGLRGPPRRVIEIERIPCRRRRRCRSVCYEHDYETPPPIQQPATLIANPLTDPYLSQVQSPLIAPNNNPSAWLSNLTPEIIENLPRQTVHLPPIHLPGSQANDETGLNSVIFPAEIINPVDGSLSIIQADPGIHGGGSSLNIQSNLGAPIQPQLIRMPTTIGAPVQPQLIRMPTTTGAPAIRPIPAGLPMAPGGLPVSPRMASDPVMQRFQDIFQRLRFPSTQAPAPAQPPIIRPTIPTMTEFNPMNNPPIIPPVNPLNTGAYPSTNIRPSNTPNTANYPSSNIRPSNPTNIGTYRPANITPYSPANITPYRPSTFTPSTTANNAMYRPANITPSNPLNNNPYRPANITPYSNIGNRPIGNLSSQSTFSSAPTPYAQSPSIASSGSFTTFPPLSSSPPGIYSNIINSSQTTNSTPKSILRNGTSNGISTTPYTNFNPFNVSFSNDATQTTTRST